MAFGGVQGRNKEWGDKPSWLWPASPRWFYHPESTERRRLVSCKHAAWHQLATIFLLKCTCAGHVRPPFIWTTHCLVSCLWMIGPTIETSDIRVDMSQECRINRKLLMNKLCNFIPDTILYLSVESSNFCVQNRQKYIKLSNIIIWQNNVFKISMLFNETWCGAIIKINTSLVKVPRIKGGFIHLLFKCIGNAIL